MSINPFPGKNKVKDNKSMIFAKATLELLIEATLKDARYDKNSDPSFQAFCNKLDKLDPQKK